MRPLEQAAPAPHIKKETPTRTNPMLKTVAVILMVGVLGACAARTEITSFTDPAFSPGADISPVAVLTSGMTLGEQTATEEATATALAEYGVATLRGTSFAPPTRELSAAEQQTAARAAGARTILHIAATSKDADRRYIAPTPPSPFLSAYGAPCYYDGLWYSRHRCFAGYRRFGYAGPAGLYGPYTSRDGSMVTYPKATYELRLLDADSGETLWRADAKGKGGAATDHADLGRDVAADIVKKMHADGVI